MANVLTVPDIAGTRVSIACEDRANPLEVLVEPGAGGNALQANGNPIPSTRTVNFVNVSAIDFGAEFRISPLSPVLFLDAPSSPGTLDWVTRIADVQTATGPTEVIMPDPLGAFAQIGGSVQVYDAAGNAAANPVTIQPNGGAAVEDPTSPGTYRAVAFTLAVDNFAVTWTFTSLGRWKVTAYFT